MFASALLLPSTMHSHHSAMISTLMSGQYTAGVHPEEDSARRGTTKLSTDDRAQNSKSTTEHSKLRLEGRRHVELEAESEPDSEDGSAESDMAEITLFEAYCEVGHDDGSSVRSHLQMARSYKGSYPSQMVSES
eukprot:134087-Rhodomonas_salina.3